MKHRNYIQICMILTIVSILVVSCTSPSTGEFSGIDATVYKSPLCGCCVGYSTYLENQGFNVQIVETIDMDQIKEKYGIPPHMESCHTTVIGEYFVEGHVPIEAIRKLLTERPQIEGISLPRMPSGTPGMPGPKIAPYQISAFQGGLISGFMVI